MKALRAFTAEYRRCRRNKRETRWGALGEGLYIAACNVPGRIPGKLGGILFGWHCRIRAFETKRRFFPTESETRDPLIFRATAHN